MIKPFKFFEGELKILNHYNAPYIPLLRTPPGSYYDRTINPDLYGGVRLSELSDRVQQIARDSEFIPASYIRVPIPQQQTHGFCVGIYNTQLILHYEGDMDIESVRAMTWDLQFRYANYVSINEQIIGFMEDFLNEHLSGTSIITLA
jgi:hypothetical protein